MTKANYHTHTYLCGHAEGLPTDYIKKAINIGMVEIGISDHGYLNPKWTGRMNLDSFENIYLKDINDAISKYSSKISIKKGLELEFHPKYDNLYKYYLTKLDYLILGQHIIEKSDNNIDMFSSLSDNDIVEYKNMVIKGLQSGYFKILAHPDLFMYKYKKWNSLTESISREIIIEAINCGVYLELNANGARRGTFYNDKYETVWNYPRLEFWRIVSEYSNAKVIIGDDAHKIDFLHDSKIEELLKFGKELNLNMYDVIF